MKIGIIGGTFDPPHLGHLALAEAALAQLELDEVLFIPANRNPMKSGKAGATAKQRAAMVDLMIRREPHMAYSDMEIARGGQSYTVETLADLQMVQPADYWFIMGADALKGLPEWKNPLRLIKLCRIAAAIRPPHSLQETLVRLPEEMRPFVDPIEMTGMDVSSTDLRDKIARGITVSPWLAPEVLQYINANKLYR